ncbi:MAG: hypothetical protein U0O22_01715 [Acutalibacteraceae bacterium]|nr:hypothetical protein [Acutalibacteraceae bacterium]
MARLTTEELIKKNEEEIAQQEENVRVPKNKFMNDITNSEYQSILLNRLSYQKQLFVEFVSKLLLKGTIILEEIPQDLRINNRTIYISSLRISRSSCISLIKDLKLILSDLEYMSSSDKENIITILSNEIQYLEIKYLGDKEIEDFKRTVPREILQRL